MTPERDIIYIGYGTYVEVPSHGGVTIKIEHQNSVQQISLNSQQLEGLITVLRNRNYL